MMQKLGIVHQKVPYLRKIDGQISFGSSVINGSLFQVEVASVGLKAIRTCQTRSALLTRKQTSYIKSSKLKGVPDENVEELSDYDEDDDEPCPVDCVREFQTDEEFLSILEKAKESSALVIVDFYRTSCGSCKYIEQGFAKICKGAGSQEAPVIFLKHNVSIYRLFSLCL